MAPFGVKLNVRILKAKMEDLHKVSEETENMMAGLPVEINVGFLKILDVLWRNFKNYSGSR